MATYKQIQDYIKDRYGYTVKTCWIAHVKEITGILETPRNPLTPRVYPCPEKFIVIIEDAMKSFKMIQ